MTHAALNRVGALDIVDLTAISESHGREFIPYPFQANKPSRFSNSSEYEDYVRSVPDRFYHDDLRIFRQWAGAYVNADLRVECHVRYTGDTPHVRIMAHRAGELGFFAAQRSDDDVIDVFTVSPYELGVAIAGAVELTEPGKHAEIVVPDYVRHTKPAVESEDAGDLVIKQAVTGISRTEVPHADVTALATIQSHFLPTRKWGVDQNKNGVVWLRVKDDGDYIYAPDFSHATPLTRPALAKRIDLLIAEDIAKLREFRST
ncbi:MAG: hypothetical protein H6523_15060 [Mycolicibacterium sp.]|nr:hypothetical protein [Mycolicibacterium sp.]